jgi:SAM-dependent methyltransferase
MKGFLLRARRALSMLRISEAAVAPGRCPFCGPTLFIRLSHAASGLRCARCSAGSVQLSIGWAIRGHVPDIGACDACELSSGGPVARWLAAHARRVATSEYFADAEPGELRNGVRCEDVQRLSYADASFDLVTHTEVLEHVPDDRRALGELLRVLRPGGYMVFTVPLHGGERTVERARLRDGVIEHLLEPVHHTDPLRGEGILAFRDYGNDIVERLRDAGFGEARILPPSKHSSRIDAHPVVVARRPAR